MYGESGDLAEFFEADGSGGSVLCTRTRAATQDLTFAANFGREGDDGFEGHVQDLQVRLQFPAVRDVRAGDMLVIGTKQYAVEQVDPINDGAECIAILLPRGTAP